MSKKKTKAEEPKRIYKETIDIEVEKSQDEIQGSKDKLQDLVMEKYNLEQSIEKAKLQLKEMAHKLKRATEECELTTRTEEVEAIVKVYANSMKKEYYVNDELHKTEDADRWDLQTDTDDLNYVEEEEEVTED